MNYSEKEYNVNNEEKTTIKDYPEMNQGLPVQQVITDGEEPTAKELRDATREMGIDIDTPDRG